MTASELDLMETVLPCCVYHSSHEAVIVHAQNKTRSPRGFTQRGTASGDNFVNNVNRCCATDVSFAEAIRADCFVFFHSFVGARWFPETAQHSFQVSN